MAAWIEGQGGGGVWGVDGDTDGRDGVWGMCEVCKTDGEGQATTDLNMPLEDFLVLPRALPPRSLLLCAAICARCCALLRVGASVPSQRGDVGGGDAWLQAKKRTSGAKHKTMAPISVCKE
eukprot:2535496-Rhodomonas_salina.1